MRSQSTLWLLSCLIVVCLTLPTSAQPSFDTDDRKADLLFPEPTSILTIYRFWGETYGVNVLFDPKLKDARLTIELRDVTALESLRILNLTAYHFFHTVNEKTLLMADDTPQNRRTYERQAIQTFVLEDLELKDAMTAVRSLIGAKNVTADEGQNALVLRDTVDKIRIAGAILRTLDKPRAEAVLEVEVFHLEGRHRDATAAKLRRGSGENRKHGFPPRLASSSLDPLRGAARTLAGPTLNVLSGETGEWQLTDSFEVGEGKEKVRHRVSLTLEVEARVKPVSDAVEVRIELTATNVTGTAGTGPVTGERATSWSARLEAGESLLLSGFLRTGQKAVSANPESLFVSFFEPAAEDRGEILIALTPRIIRKPGYTEKDLAPFYVGTESNISFPASGDRGF